MTQTYGHIVYTRRACGFNIEGKTVYKSGHGIHSLTSNLLEGDRDVDLINHVLDCSKPPAKEIKPKYVYFVPTVGMPMLGKIRNRNEAEMEEAAKKGIDARGTFFSEWITGEFIKYPFEYFDSPFFVADLKPVEEYYQEDPAPLETPLPAEMVENGNIKREKIMEFAADRREHAIQAAVCELLQQIEKPENERKFLVIRDTEENVRKWIAAIVYAFPIAAAREISFDTRMLNLNEDSKSSYAVQKSTGRFIRQKNIQDPNQENRFYAMIAGADPKDSSVSKTANPMTNAPYFVIDGETKQAKFAANSLSQRSYIKAVVHNDNLIRDFCSHMNEMTGIKLDSSLCDLFDAQVVVANDNEWQYASLLKALKCLLPHFTNKSVLMLLVVDKLCNEGGYLQRFLVEDEKHGLELFGIVRQILTKFKLENAKTEFEKAIDLRFSQLLANPSYVQYLKNFEKDLKQRDEKLYQDIIQKTVIERKLSVIQPQTIAAAPVEYIQEVVVMINYSLTNNTFGWNEILESIEYSSLITEIVRRCVFDEKLAASVIMNMSGNTKAVDKFIMMGSALNGQKSEESRWWRTMLSNNVSIDRLCKLMYDGKVGETEIEALLCTELRSHGYSEQLRSLFNTYLAKVPGVGGNFYREWIKSIRSTRNSNRELKRVLTDIASNSNYAKLLNEILTSLDAEVQLTENNENADLVEIVNEFASRARIVCPNAMLWSYLDFMNKSKISRRDKDGIAGLYLSSNMGGYRFQAQSDILKTPMGKDFFKRLTEYYEDPAVHLVAVMSFSFNDSAANKKYLTEYAETLCNLTVKQKGSGLASVLYLRQCLADGTEIDVAAEDIIRLFNCDEVLQQVNALVKAIKDVLCDIKTENVSDRLIDNAEKDFDERTAKELGRILDSAQEVYRQNHKGGLFGKLFGGFKK